MSENENKTAEKKEEKKNDPADDIAHFIIMIGFFLITNAIIFFGFGFDTNKIMNLDGMPNLYRTMVENVGVDVTKVVNVILHIPLMFTLLLDIVITGFVLTAVLGIMMCLTVAVLSVPYDWLHSIVYAIVKRFVPKENPVNENTEKQTIDDLANAVNSPPDQTKRDLEKILQEAEKEKTKEEGKLPVC